MPPPAPSQYHLSPRLKNAASVQPLSLALRLLEPLEPPTLLPPSYRRLLLGLLATTMTFFCCCPPTTTTAFFIRQLASLCRGFPSMDRYRPIACLDRQCHPAVNLDSLIPKGAVRSVERRWRRRRMPYAATFASTSSSHSDDPPLPPLLAFFVSFFIITIAIGFFFLLLLAVDAQSPRRSLFIYSDLSSYVPTHLHGTSALPRRVAMGGEAGLFKVSSSSVLRAIVFAVVVVCFVCVGGWRCWFFAFRLGRPRSSMPCRQLRMRTTPQTLDRSE